MNKKVDLVGKKFGRLSVLEKKYKIRKSGMRDIVWICKCECGNIKSIPTSSLLKGLTKSCGCLHNEMLILRNKEMALVNKYDLSNDYGVGYTSKGEEFYFDLDDYDKIKGYCWHINRGYVQTNIKNKTEKIHRVILNITESHEDMVVDHINHDTTDNRRCNLRICSNQENCFNSSLSKNNNSGVIGVSWHTRDCVWQSRLGKNKEMYLGQYTNINDAITARLLAEKKYYGKFAPQKHLFKRYGIEVD